MTEWDIILILSLITVSVALSFAWNSLMKSREEMLVRRAKRLKEQYAPWQRAARKKGEPVGFDVIVRKP
jgi:hypothetical protein